MPVVCSKCKHLLEGTSGPTTYKLCIHCVQNKYPASNKKKIKELYENQPAIITEKQINSMIAESEAKNLTKKNELIFSIIEQDGVYMAHFKIVIPSTGKHFELAFNKEQLSSFINEIEDVEAKHE